MRPKSEDISRVLAPQGRYPGESREWPTQRDGPTAAPRRYDMTQADYAKSSPNLGEQFYRGVSFQDFFLISGFPQNLRTDMIQS